MNLSKNSNEGTLKITDGDIIISFKSSNSITRLELKGRNITNLELFNSKQFPLLNSLNLTETKISNNNIELSFEKLEYLDIGGTDFTKLSHLLKKEKFPILKILRIGHKENKKIRKEEIEKFRKERPDVEIYFE